MSALAAPDLLATAAPHIRLSTIHSHPHSQPFLLPHEDQAVYQGLLARYLGAYRPECSEELALVHALHQTRWRIDRLVAIESGIIALGTAENIGAIETRFGSLDEPARRALAQSAGFLANARPLEQLHRQEARLHRLYLQTRSELDHLIALRCEPDPEPAVAPTSPPNPAGFVPSKSPEPMPQFTGPMKDIKRKQWLRKQRKKQTEASTL